MSSRFASIVWCAGAAFLSTGCYTTISVRFGNATQETVQVRSSENEHEAKIKAGQSGKIPNATGDLIVTTASGGKLRFNRVAPFDLDKKYLIVGHSPFGPNSVTLKVALQTNLDLYILNPTGKPFEAADPQPQGYPKHAER